MRLDCKIENAFATNIDVVVSSQSDISLRAILAFSKNNIIRPTTNLRSLLVI